MKFKHLMVFSILIIVVTLSCVSANENVTDDISQSQDIEVLENTVSGTTFGDIQKAVNSAKANDVIELNGTYSSSGKSIKININLVFDGGSAGATLDAKKSSGIFTTSLTKYTITLKNINFINAKNSVFIDEDNYNSKGKLIIENCNFTNNDGFEYGAIACYDCVAKNSNFIANNAKGLDDGVDLVSWGGAINAQKCTLTNCNFEKNTGMSDGGAVYANGEIVNCNFKQNSAQYDGGAIFGDVNVKNSNFTSNTAKKGSGGAIYGSGKIQNSTFDKNTAKRCGGAIEGSVNVVDSLFSSNAANYAGAIHCHGEDGVSITNSRFVSNADAAVISWDITIKSPDKKFKGKKILDNNLNSINLIKVSVKKLSTYYRSGKNLEIKLTKTTSNKPASNLGVCLYVKSGKKAFDAWKYTDEYIHSNSKGIATFKASKLPAGKYTIKIFEEYVDNDDGYFTCPFPVTYVTVKIYKHKTVVKAPKITAKFKKTKYFKVTVKSKKTKKPLSKLGLNVKVFTGKKYKTYKIKTNKKGVAKLNTKKLGWGAHKVVIKPKNTSYRLYAKSKITIR